MTDNTEELNVQTEYDLIRAKLLHTLDVYPQVATSMLQIAMNPLKAAQWRPILEDLISEGEVVRFQFSTTSPVGRNITHTIIQGKEPKIMTPTYLRKSDDNGDAEESAA